MSARGESSFFEISLDDDNDSKALGSPRIPKKLIKTPVEISADDIAKKLEVATERRSKILQDTQEKNENYVQKIKTIVKEEKEKHDSFKVEKLQELETSLAVADERRQQILDEKVNFAKKELEKVQRRRLSVSLESEDKLKKLAQDMSNKENNRRSVIKSIQETCQIEVEKVAEVQSRKSLSISNADAALQQ